MDTRPEMNTGPGHISKKRKIQEQPHQEDALNTAATEPSILQAHDLTQSFHLLVTSLNEQIKAEKAKVVAQAAELSAKDQQILSLQEERDGLQRSTDEDDNAVTVALMEGLLNEEKQNNLEITKRLAEVEEAKAELEKKVEQLMKDKEEQIKKGEEELQRLTSEHEKTVKQIESYSLKRLRKARAEVEVMKTQHQKAMSQAEEYYMQDIGENAVRVKQSIDAAKAQAEKKVDKAERKAEKEISKAKAEAVRSELKAEKYEKVFNAARPLVRYDSNRDWPAFGQNMKNLSDAVKERI